MEASAVGVTWDNKSDDINFAGPKEAAGIYFGNKYFGFDLEVSSFDIGLISGKVKALSIEATGNVLDLCLGDNKLDGVHLAEGSIFDSSEKSSWFNGNIGVKNEPNRMVDIDNNGILTLMMIIGGEVKRGLSGTVEWNVSQTASRTLGGSGVGNGWKKQIK